MRTAKQPRPPPNKTPAVAPKKVATPTGSTSCHGMMCRKKSGAIFPEPKPKRPPITIPATAQPLTTRNVVFHFMAPSSNPQQPEGLLIPPFWVVFRQQAVEYRVWRRHASE